MALLLPTPVAYTQDDRAHTMNELLSPKQPPQAQMGDLTSPANPRGTWYPSVAQPQPQPQLSGAAPARSRELSYNKQSGEPPDLNTYPRISLVIS